MERRTLLGFGLLAAMAVAWPLTPRCHGQESQADDAKFAAGPAKKLARRDPVEAAFAIPYGTILNSKQQSEYDRLKGDKEPALREATEALAAATSAAEKAELQKEIDAIRREIRMGMRQIAAMPYIEAAQGRQQKVMEQGYDPSAQAGYYGPGIYPGYYGGAYAVMPSYGYAGGWWGTAYPWYGGGYGDNWRNYHRYDGQNKVINRPIGTVINRPLETKKSGDHKKAQNSNPTPVPLNHAVPNRPAPAPAKQTQKHK